MNYHSAIREEKFMNSNPDSKFYYRWDYANNYLVYKNVFDPNKCSVEEGSRAHWYGKFANEEDAKLFCELKNMEEKVGYAFKVKLEQNTKDLNPEFSKVIDDNFWELF